MSKLSHTTAAVVIPPRESWPAIQTIRRRHDRKIGRWMPHITLLYPFLPVDRFDDVRATLSDACRSITPSEVVLAEFRSFRHRHDNHTVWLAPEPEESLVELHAAVCRSLAGFLPQAASSRRFCPHLSVGQIRGKQQCSELMTRLQADWTPLGFEVNEISLIWRNEPPDDQFRLACAIPLERQ